MFFFMSYIMSKFKFWILHYNIHNVLYDRLLLWLLLGLSSVGFVMITSSSMVVGMRMFGDSFHFTKRFLIYFFLFF